MWLSTVRIAYPAFHLWSGHVDHTVWETTGRIRDRARGWRGEEVELRAVETEESVGDWQIEKNSVDFSPLLLKKIDVSREKRIPEKGKTAQKKRKPCADDHTGRKEWQGSCG